MDSNAPIPPAEPSRHGAASPRKAAHRGDPRASSASVFVVDDVRANLMLMAAILKERHHRVSTFDSGSQALDAAALAPPDMFLLDINMPGMDGYEICRRLKADPATAAIPVIFISSMSEALDKVKAFQCGAVDYVEKPFQVEEVLARVDTHLDLRRLQLALEIQNSRLDHIVQIRTQQLEDANARLSILDRAKTAFLRMISHELRTPLQGLFGVADLLFAACPTDPENQELKAYFIHSRNRLARIVDDALLLSSIETVSERFAPDSVLLGPILDDALVHAEPTATARSVTIERQPAADGAVLGETKLFVRAFRALFDAMVKLTASGGRCLVSHVWTPEGACVLLQATGVTVPVDVLPRFFDILGFDEALTVGGDLGLGPPVAERILSVYGGRVAIENCDPPGVRFSVHLRTPGLPDPATNALEQALPPGKAG